MNAQTIQSINALLIQNNIDPDALSIILKQGIEMEKLYHESKILTSEFDYLKSQARIMESQKFLALLCCL